MKILRLPVDEPFVTGTYETHEVHSNQILKLEDAALLYCLRGEGILEIDMQPYDVSAQTQILLLPSSIFHCTYASADFTLAYLVFSNNLFQEITSRFDPSFFYFLKEHPCIGIPPERVKIFAGLSHIMIDLYNDRSNLFRLQIFKNFIQNYLMDFYDKTQHLFSNKRPENLSRQEILFKRFIQLVLQYCTSQREVAFYATELCITPRYLSSIVQSVSGQTAKSHIDRHVILESKALLQSTDLSIQEISNQLRFPNQSFFGRYFKRHTGLSPLQYRNLCE